LTTAGGTAVANVLANDRIGGIAVTLGHVTLTQVSSTSESLALDAATGAVTLAAGATIGVETLVYRLCEIADPSNCDDAAVTVNVLAPYVIDAVNDNGGVTFPGRTVVGTVLTNDTLGGTPATTARVTLSTVSSTAAGITLDAATGSVFVALGTAAGAHTLTHANHRAERLRAGVVEGGGHGDRQRARERPAWRRACDADECQALVGVPDTPPTARSGSISPTAPSTCSARRTRAPTCSSTRSARSRCRPIAHARRSGSI
jgi:hypothetical protein